MDNEFSHLRFYEVAENPIGGMGYPLPGIYELRRRR